MTATHFCIQAIPLLAAVALTAIAFTGREDIPVPVHACAPGMNDRVCEEAIAQNKRALSRLPQWHDDGYANWPRRLP